MSRWGLGRLAADRRGSPLVEFAMLLPALLTLLMGVCELAYTGYLRAILAGSMQKAGRDSGIQGGDTKTAAIDAAVLAAVRQVAPKASFAAVGRKSYTQFSYIGAEPFTDSNTNGKCDAGEPFTDYNHNKVWDAESGADGQGGASDVTVYTVAIRYPRLFPLNALIGMGTEGSLSSTVILKNQPYASQDDTRAVTTEKCP